MRHHAVLVMAMVAVGVVSACSDDEGGAGTAGTGGSSAGGSTGGSAGVGGAAGTSGGGGSTSSGGAAGMGTPVPPPIPALPADAPTVACGSVINASLEASDRSQTGRHSRIPPSSACGMPKGYPGNAADATNPHLYDVYRFVNPAATPVCFTWALTYGGLDAGDAGPDDAGAEAGAEGAQDASVGADAAVVAPVNTEPAKYLTAYSTFYPTSLATGYLGDVGDALTSPQAMGVTVPAGGTIDVVVYAIDVAPAGVGSYALSCSTQ